MPIRTQTFSALREAKQLYVDKTALIGELITDRRHVFLARPRRFGKSLLLTTLASLFAHGLRDFSGLAIASTWKETQTYPVIHLDFSENHVSMASVLVSFRW